MPRRFRAALLAIMAVGLTSCDNPFEPLEGGYVLIRVDGENLPVMVESMPSPGIVESGYLYLGDEGRYQVSTVEEFLDGTIAEIRASGRYRVGGTLYFAPDDPQLPRYQGVVDGESVLLSRDLLSVDGGPATMEFIAE